MPVINGVFEPRTPLVPAEETVRWKELNRYILTQRQRNEKATEQLARQLGNLVMWGMPTTMAKAQLAAAYKTLILEAWRYGFEQSQRELAELRRRTGYLPPQHKVLTARHRALEGGLFQAAKWRRALQISKARTYAEYAHLAKEGHLKELKDYGDFENLEELQAAVDEVSDEQSNQLADAVEIYAKGAAEEKGIEAVERAVSKNHLNALDMVGNPLNTGRAMGAMSAEGGPPTFALRSEQLDKRTCGPCTSLHGTITRVDSVEFYDILPPNGCLGQGRCRGVMVFSDGPSDLRSFERAAEEESYSAEIQGLADQVLEKATRHEARISGDLRSIARARKAKMVGLEHRMKGKASLSRKIAADVDDKGVTAAKAAAEISDANRYTMVFRANEYTRGAEQAMQALKERGYEIEKVKNYWAQGNAYRGINIIAKTPGGQRFELQFHTPASYAMKTKTNHKWYEVWRDDTKGLGERAAASQRMVSNASALKMPKGADKIGDAVNPRGLFGYNSRDLSFAGRADHALKTGGGYSLGIDGQPARTRRYISAVDKTHEQVVRNITPFDYANYRRRYAGEVAGGRGRTFFGGWRDGENTYLDLSTSFDDLEEALRYAGQHGQIAIWDARANKEIRVPARYRKRQR